MSPEKIRDIFGVVVAWMFKSPLRLFIALFLSLATFEAAVVLTVDAKLRDFGQSQALEHNINDGKLIGKIIKEHFDGVANYTESYSRRQVVQNALIGHDRDAMAELLKEMVDENSSISRVFMSDTSGTTLAVYPPDPSVVGVNFAYREWYRAVIGRGRTIVSEIYRTAAVPQPIVIAVVTPVRSKDGRVVGFIASQVRIDSLSDWIKNHSPTSHTSVYILDRQGHVAQNPEPSNGAMINFSGNQTVNALIAGSSMVANDPLTGTPSLASSFKVPAFDWNILVYQPYSEVLAAADSISRMLSVVAVVSFIAGLILLFNWLNVVRSYTTNLEHAREEARAARANVEVLNADLSGQLAILFQSRQWMKTILAHTPLVLWSVDTQGIFTLIEGSFTEKLKLEPQRILGSSYFDINAHRPDAIACVRGALEGQVRTLSAKFEDIYLDSFFVPLKDADGAIKGVIGLATDVTVRHLAEQKITASQSLLLESERRFRRMIDTIPQLSWIAGPDGKIEYFNQRWTEYTGLDLEQSLSGERRDIVHAEDAAKMNMAWSGALGTGVPFETKYRLRAKDDRYRWHLARALPLLDETGKITHWFGTATDIHAQVLEQQAIALAKQRFETVIKSLDVIIWATDDRGIIQFFEGKGMASVGLRAEDRVGKAVSDLHAPGDPMNIAIEMALAGTPSTFEVTLRETLFEMSCYPILADSVDIVGVAGVASNISVRRRIEFELLQSKARLDSVVSTSPIILWATDAQGILTLADGSALKGIGMQPNQKIGESIFTVTAHQPEVSAALRTALGGEQVFIESVFGERHFSSMFTPVKDSSGLVTGINGISTDVTDQRKSEELRRDMEVRERAALQSAKTKSEFLANMSHEIRTPINGVIGMTSLLLDSRLDAEQRDYAECVKVSADALLTVINDILDFSKVEAGKLDFECVDFSMAHLARDIEKSFGHLALKKGLVLVVDNKLGERAHYQGDPGRIRQVLTNLTSNAIKFTPSGTILISISHEATTPSVGGVDTLRMSLKDTGIGISSEAMGRLFQAFSQADASTARRFGGTGLGLSICKHLVGMMGGEISVESSLGEGSTFSFTIKLKSIPAPAIVQNAGFLVPVSQSNVGKRILLAEDNIINQKVALAMLEKMGYRAQAVANGKEAISALKLIAYDLILMDCQMPEIDGYEATRQIRLLDGPDDQIPIVAMTANAFKDDRDRCIEAGMNDYISKPVKAVDLARTIEHWLNASRSQRQSA